MRSVIGRLVNTPTPLHDIQQLISKRNAPGRTPFERYAGIVLNDAGGQALASWPLSQQIQLIPPGSGYLVRLACNRALSEEDQGVLHDVESALNRLVSIVDTIEDSADFGEPSDKMLTVGYSPLGTGFLPERPGYRTALVNLPPIGPTEQPTLAYLNEVDWRALDYIADNAHTVFQSSTIPNLYSSFLGAHAPDHSDWDVRTRMASMITKLELPLAFTCTFDCNVDEHAAAIRFKAPRTSAFPQFACSDEPGSAEGSTDAPSALVALGNSQIEAAQLAYTVRLSCLLSAACFGSGRRLERAFITAMSADGQHQLFTCQFNRQEYVRHTLTAIDSSALFDPALRFDPQGVIAIAQPTAFAFGKTGDDEAAPTAQAEPLSVWSAGTAAVRIEPHLDTRPLPEDMQRLFHARRVCDITTHHPLEKHASAINEARSDSNESILAAIAQLEGIVEELETDLVPPDDDANARPLYCAHPLSRATVSLLDDEYAVSMQAEAFLHGQPIEEIPPERIPYYFRAPGALFHAYLGLSDLYERLGDTKGAIAQADKALALAPTTAQAYYRKGSILAEQGLYHQAANVFIAGLHTAVSQRDCALLYYHLALALRTIGHDREAAAVFVYTTVFGGEHADKALKIIRAYRKRKDSPIILSASPLAASKEMVHARIPLAPSDECRLLITRAAVGLSCANAPLAAAPYAAALTRYFKDDPLLVAIAHSLAQGIETPLE